MRSTWKWGLASALLAAVICSVLEVRAQPPGTTPDASPPAPIGNPFETTATVRIQAPGPAAGSNIKPRMATPYVKTYESRTPSLTVDWVTPELVSVGQEGDFELVMRNRGQAVIEHLIIEQVLPRGFVLIDAQPKPVQLEDQPVWTIEALKPEEEYRIGLRLKPVVAGEASSHARVTFSTSSSTKFRVVEPLLKLTADVPESVILGNQAILNVTVENPGTAPTTNTVINVVLSGGLAPVAKSTTYEIGTLNPGESRSVRVLANVTQLGDHPSQFIATADNDLRDEQKKSIRGLGAILETKIDGPHLRYVSRPATFTIIAENKGTAPATNVNVRCAVPQSFGFLGASAGGKYDAASKTVNWIVGDLEAGGKVEVECELRALDRGEFPVLALSFADRGLRSLAKHETTVEGIAAILLEVVDVDDPVEVGAETGYEILITNQGTDFAPNVQVKLEVPEGMTITGSKGPSKGVVSERTLVFEPIAQLAPRADAIYRVQIRGEKAGDFRVTVHASSDTLKTPVTEEESTKVYQD